MAPRAFIAGLSGLTLTNEERTFLREADLWGAILFKRNVSDKAQVSDLTKSIRDTLGREAVILVDQEGGRVQRLAPPHWPPIRPARALCHALRLWPRSRPRGRRTGAPG